MPIIKSAKKAARQAEKRTKQNVQIKKSIKVATKAFVAKPSMETLRKAQSELDKAVKKDLLKKNTASRRKSALVRKAKAAGVKFTATTKKVASAPATKKTVAKTTAAKSAPKTVSKATKAKAASSSSKDQSAKAKK